PPVFFVSHETKIFNANLVEIIVNEFAEDGQNLVDRGLGGCRGDVGRPQRRDAVGPGGRVEIPSRGQEPPPPREPGDQVTGRHLGPWVSPRSLNSPSASRRIAAAVMSSQRGVREKIRRWLWRWMRRMVGEGSPARSQAAAGGTWLHRQILFPEQKHRP